MGGTHSDTELNHARRISVVELRKKTSSLQVALKSQQPNCHTKPTEVPMQSDPKNKNKGFSKRASELCLRGLQCDGKHLLRLEPGGHQVGDFQRLLHAERTVSLASQEEERSAGVLPRSKLLCEANNKESKASRNRQNTQMRPADGAVIMSKTPRPWWRALNRSFCKTSFDNQTGTLWGPFTIQDIKVSRTWWTPKAHRSGPPTPCSSTRSSDPQRLDWQKCAGPEVSGGEPNKINASGF